MATLRTPGGAAGVRFGFGSLWVTDPSSQDLTRLDPETGEVQATVAVDYGASFQDVSDDSVWVMNNSLGTVLRVDPATNSVVARVTVADGGVDGGDLTVGGGSVWARVSDALVVRVDPATNEVTARLGEPKGSGSAASDGRNLWVSAHDVFAVYRIPVG